MNLAFIGIGNVGYSIADNLGHKGHTIYIAHDNPDSYTVRRALELSPKFEVLPVREAVEKADIVFLATPFKAAKEALDNIKFHDKPLVDCTNPIGGGLSHSLQSQSGGEMIQSIAGDSNVVKAFNTYGYENFKLNAFTNKAVKPMMPIAGDDDKSKQLVKGLIEQMGFECVDTGNLYRSIHIEHLALLWINMVRFSDQYDNFMWAKLDIPKN
ncbi:MAG: NADPH-dependent F420 reductase [Candidatus Kapabacteria bacterium]|nr:NADPH-dependent F420 reductase [Ignavibacteriota bacterium]MCW5884263.1 NADPH-dependent F420 reductase [Candidatus Kapabacteria bacterium]